MEDSRKARSYMRTTNLFKFAYFKKGRNSMFLGNYKAGHDGSCYDNSGYIVDRLFPRTLDPAL